jgi:hypothetical protein
MAISVLQDISVEDAIDRAMRLAYLAWCAPECAVDQARQIKRAVDVVRVATPPEGTKKEITAVSDCMGDALRNIQSRIDRR